MYKLYEKTVNVAETVTKLTEAWTATSSKTTAIGGSMSRQGFKQNVLKVLFKSSLTNVAVVGSTPLSAKTHACPEDSS